jgi:hypothetical protein
MPHQLDRLGHFDIAPTRIISGQMTRAFRSARQIIATLTFAFCFLLLSPAA